jgi:Winged helix DNA-binding domain
MTEDRVDRARLRDRSIVWTWAMRGTLHLIPSDVLGWLVPLTMESGVTQARRRLPELGIPADPERAVRAVHRMLDRDGPLTRREIEQRLRRAGYRPEGYAAPYLVWLGTPRHIVVFGPDRDGEKTYVLSRDWVGRSEALDRQSALAELAGRYLAAHGPATPADLAFWAGIRAAEARRGWKAIEDRLEEVETTRGPMWRLRSHRSEAPRGIVRLLPSFDEYLLGWKDRFYVADPSTWRRVNPGAGWYHPTVVADGRAIGTWKTEKRKGGIALRVRGFSTVPPALRRKFREEGHDVGRYLRRPVDVVVG